MQAAPAPPGDVAPEAPPFEGLHAPPLPSATPSASNSTATDAAAAGDASGDLQYSPVASATTVDTAERPRCEFEGCGKSFLTVAHVVRHQRSHHGTGVKHPCSYPGCGKEFARTDVLARHVSAVHNAVDPKTIKKPSCAPCRIRKIKCDGVDPGRCSRCVKLNLDCAYAKSAIEPRPSPYPSTSTSRARSVSSVNAFSSDTRAPASAPEITMDDTSPHSTHSYHSQGSASFTLPMQAFNNPPVLPPAAAHFPLASTSSTFYAQPSTLPPLPLPASPPMSNYSFDPIGASAALNSMAVNPFDYTDPLGASTGFGDVSTSFDTSLGWGADDTTLDFMDVFGAGALLAGGGSGTITPSTSAWLSGLGTFTAPAAGVVDPPPREIVAGAVAATAQGSAAQGSSPQANVQGPGTEGRELGEEGREGGTWPHIYQPASASTPLSLPQVASPAAPPPPAGAQGVVITDAEVQGLVRLIHSSHASPWQHVAISSFPDAGTVRHCIDLYFRRFHPSFPVLSQHRFQRASEPPPAVLLLAVVAIGASFDQDMAIMVLPLAELCRRVILFLRESDPRLSFEIHIIQAWLLCHVLGVFCGSKKLYFNFEDGRSGLVTAARRMHLLHSFGPYDLGPAASPTHEDPSLSEEVRFSAYVQEEERLRLGWGIYYFDTQASSLLNLKPLFAISEISLTCRLPDAEDRFSTSSAAAWAASPATSPPHFRTVMEELLTKNRSERSLSPFGLSIVAVSLYRLCLDASSNERIFGVAEVPRPGPYRLAFASCFAHNPQAVLDSVSSTWYRSATPSPLLVSASATALHASLQFTCGRLFFQVKEAGGKWGNGRPREEAIEWLVERMQHDVVGVRRILARAAQLNALLLRFASFENPIEVVWLFDAALALFAIRRFGGDELLQGVNSLTERTIVKWDSPSDAYESWVERGGPLSLKGGLGNYNRLTPGGVLEHFVERLETQPWGLARRYCAALASLAEEEERRA